MVSSFKADYNQLTFHQDHLTGEKAIVNASKIAQVPDLAIAIADDMEN